MASKRGRDDAAGADVSQEVAAPLAGQHDYVAEFLQSCQTGDAAVASHLAQSPAIVRAADAATAWTGLHAAVKGGQLATARLLLDSGADVCALTQHDSSPLHIAACNEAAGHQSEIAKLLIGAGCPLEARDNKGNTALLRACQHGAASVAAALLAARADPRAKNTAGEDCLARASAGGHASVASLLQMFS